MELRELAFRETEDGDVTLLWGQDERGVDHTFVRVSTEGDGTEIEVKPQRALEEYEHVFARVGSLALAS